MNDVNVVIDNLASKLGVASEVLIPEMSRFYIAKGLMGTIVSGVIMIVCVISILKINKIIKSGITSDDNFDEDPWTFASLLLGMLGIITLIVFIVYLSDLVGFLASPMGATISIIIENLSN